MNNQEAAQIAEKITRTWRGSIGTEIWYDMLLELHFGPAEATWRTLRDTLDHQPSIALFRSAYHAQLGTAHEPHTPCDNCSGDGWVTRKYTVLNIEYAGVSPCNCRNGDHVMDVHRRIIAANDAELATYKSASTPDAVPRPDWLVIKTETAR